MTTARMAPTASSYLGRRRVPYQVVDAVGPDDGVVARAVVLTTGAGYLLAVVPEGDEVDMASISRVLGRPVTPVPDALCRRLFADCAPSAVPPTGLAYGLETIWDQRLAQAERVYFPAGDGRALVRVSGADFRRLMAGASPAPLSGRG